MRKTQNFSRRFSLHLLLLSILTMVVIVTVQPAAAIYDDDSLRQSDPRNSLELDTPLYPSFTVVGGGGATLIAPQWLLTTEHTMGSSQVGEPAHIGAYGSNQSNQDRESISKADVAHVINIYRSLGVITNGTVSTVTAQAPDMALVKLETAVTNRPAEFFNANPVLLDPTANSTSYTLVGRGAYDIDDPTTRPDEGRDGQVRHNEDNVFTSGNFDTDTIVIFNGWGCRQDSGGPFYNISGLSHTLIGIQSAGNAACSNPTNANGARTWVVNPHHPDHMKMIRCNVESANPSNAIKVTGTVDMDSLDDLYHTVGLRRFDGTGSEVSHGWYATQISIEQNGVQLCITTVAPDGTYEMYLPPMNDDQMFEVKPWLYLDEIRIDHDRNENTPKIVVFEAGETVEGTPLNINIRHDRTTEVPPLYANVDQNGNELYFVQPLADANASTINDIAFLERYETMHNGAQVVDGYQRSSATGPRKAIELDTGEWVEVRVKIEAGNNVRLSSRVSMATGSGTCLDNLDWPLLISATDTSSGRSRSIIHNQRWTGGLNDYRTQWDRNRADTMILNDTIQTIRLTNQDTCTVRLDYFRLIAR